ncbi:MAG: hypothetical protein KJ709_00955, partial [Nanoarchaeota archaeon]|nr:hypothetical protein [Nanoarchaeota archaeon]
MRGQIQSQIFVYILAIALVGMMLLFGYRWLDSFMEDKEQASMILLKNELKTTFDSMRHHVGDVERHTFQLPSKYSELCFVHLDADGFKTIPSIVIEGPTSSYPILEDSITNKVYINTFLVGEYGAEPLDYVGDITLDGTTSALCFENQNGNVVVRLA